MTSYEIHTLLLRSLLIVKRANAVAMCHADAVLILYFMFNRYKLSMLILYLMFIKESTTTLHPAGPPRHDELCPKIKCQKPFNEFLEAVPKYFIHSQTVWQWAC